MVSGSRIVLGVFGLSFICDVGHVTGITVDGVGDGLGTTIGKKDPVGTRHHLAVVAFLVPEIVVRSFVVNGVAEVVGMVRLLQCHQIK